MTFGFFCMNIVYTLIILSIQTKEWYYSSKNFKKSRIFKTLCRDISLQQKMDWKTNFSKWACPVLKRVHNEHLLYYYLKFFTILVIFEINPHFLALYYTDQNAPHARYASSIAISCGPPKWASKPWNDENRRLHISHSILSKLTGKASYMACRIWNSERWRR